MDKRKLEVDAEASDRIYLISNIIKVLGWLCFTIFIFVMLFNIEELDGGWYDEPWKFYIGLGGAISSLLIVITGIILRGFAIITKNAEISIAAQKEVYDIKITLDDSATLQKQS